MTAIIIVASIALIVTVFNFWLNTRKGKDWLARL